MRIWVGFSRPKKGLAWASKLIRLVEKTDYSHVYLRWQSKSGAECFFHAAETRVQFWGGEIARDRLNILEEYWVDITAEDYRKLIAFTHRNSGREYGFGQLIGMAAQRLFGLKKNPLADGRRSWVCSEAVGYFIEDILNHDLNKDLEVAGPKYINNWCVQNMNKET